MVRRIEPVSGIYLLTIHRPDALPLYYVGQSIQINRRLVYHRKTLKAGRHDNDHLQKAYNKYGANSLVVETLEVCSHSDIDELEQWWLDEMFGHQRVMNIARCATSPNRGRVFGEETRRKVAAAQIGRKYPPEFGAAVTARNTGRRLSQETIDKIKHTKQVNAPNYTKRIGALHHASRAVIGTSIQDGSVVCFESCNSARAFGFDPGGIGKACNGHWPHYKGRIWCFADARDSKLKPNVG